MPRGDRGVWDDGPSSTDPTAGMETIGTAQGRWPWRNRRQAMRRAARLNARGTSPFAKRARLETQGQLASIETIETVPVKS
jgi:hypothetical protein